MDWLHLRGIEMIEWMQGTFRDQSEEVLFLSHTGDPRNAFLIYFPLAYFLHQTTGINVLWVASISEWMNAILKWVLFGQRPYWWVNEPVLNGNTSIPHLQQYRLTCETGPGSPSGHAMVTSAVFATMITAYIQHNLNSSDKQSMAKKCILWTLFAIIMSLVSFSRCYILAHFPHQVVAGTITGVVLALICLRIPFTQFSLSSYGYISLAMLLSGPCLYWLIDSLGLEPMWTVNLAMKWCAKAEWVHMDTNLFYALTRDASALLGLGVALHFKQLLPVPEVGPSWTSLLAAIVLSIIYTRGLEFVYLPQQPRSLFYCLAFIKNISVSIVVVILVPKIVNLLIKCKNS